MCTFYGINVRGIRMIEQLMQQVDFDFISDDDKAFIIAFTQRLSKLGYTFGDHIGSGFCWGKYMLIYTKQSVKAKKVAARIYIRQRDIVLRLFLSNITKHGEYIADASDEIKRVFTGAYGDCRRCKGDNCKFRKDYAIAGTQYQKCNGQTFEFYRPTLASMEDYIDLFSRFYPAKKA